MTHVRLRGYLHPHVTGTLQLTPGAAHSPSLPQAMTTYGRDGRPPAGEPHPFTIFQPNPASRTRLITARCTWRGRAAHVALPAIRKSAVLTRANRPVAVLVPCCLLLLRVCLVVSLLLGGSVRVPCPTDWFGAAATTAARHTQGGEPLKVHRRYRRHPGHQARGPVRGDND